MPMLGDQASNADRVVAKVCAFAMTRLHDFDKSMQLLVLPLSQPSASTLRVAPLPVHRSCQR